MNIYQLNWCRSTIHVHRDKFFINGLIYEIYWWCGGLLRLRQCLLVLQQSALITLQVSNNLGFWKYSGGFYLFSMVQEHQSSLRLERVRLCRSVVPLLWLAVPGCELLPLILDCRAWNFAIVLTAITVHRIVTYSIYNVFIANCILLREERLRSQVLWFHWNWMKYFGNWNSAWLI